MGLDVYQIKNPKLIKMTIKHPYKQDVIVVLGMNKDKNDRYMLGWSESYLLSKLNIGKNIDETLVNRIMSVLTCGKCMNHSLCYRPFEKYERFVNDRNIVFGVTKNAKFDFWNVNRIIFKNNWHFIVGLASNGKDFDQDIANLMGIYGIKRSNGLVAAYDFGGENLCTDL